MKNNPEEHQIPKSEIDKLRDPEIIRQQREEGVTFQEILGYTRNRMEKYYRVARLLFEKQEYQEAGDAFVFLTTLNPYNYLYWLGLGMCEQLIGRPQGALLAYAMATLAKRDAPHPHYHSASCYQQIGDLQSAIQSLKTLIQLIGDKGEEQELREMAKRRLKHLLSSSCNEE